ncbi:hypothetical protein [Paratractidigestivibacter sp.]|uniref:hypothetical protein n=1 Tax=Paratractidigestivibacter sp. TaxID=2847316 RepID=UPI002AC9EF98|nr:hypothetical protein [Paratractidigestivibacter sp.]
MDTAGRTVGCPYLDRPTSHSPVTARTTPASSQPTIRRKPAASKRVHGATRPAAGASVRAYAGASRPRRLKGTEGVASLTSVQVDQAKASLHLRDADNGPSDTWLYMAIAADDKGQEASANTFLRGMQGLFGTETISCGGTKSDGFVVAANPASLPEAMWGNVRSHENLYIMSCRFCGRTVFANMHGGETSFCSPSCRSAYRRMLREQGAAGE